MVCDEEFAGRVGVIIGLYLKRISEGMGKDSIGRGQGERYSAGYHADFDLTRSDLILTPSSVRSNPLTMTDYDADPIWSSSRTARQIHDLGRVEKVSSLALAPLQLHNHARHTQDIGHLLSLASTSLALLSLPQTDAPDENLPDGDERSEQFVAKVGEYFETLDVRLPTFPSPHPFTPHQRH
jgi:hypothetical protein